MAANPKAIVMTAMDGKPVIVITGLKDEDIGNFATDIITGGRWMQTNSFDLFAALHQACEEYANGKRNPCK